MFRKGLFAVVAAFSLVVAASASADHKTRTYAVTITNLTYGQVLTPPLHDWRGPVARISVKRFDPDDDDDDDDD